MFELELHLHSTPDLLEMLASQRRQAWSSDDPQVDEKADEIFSILWTRPDVHPDALWLANRGGED